VGIDKIEATGLILSVLAVIAFCVLITQNSFPAFKYTVLSEKELSKHLVNTTQPIGTNVSFFMWKNRSMDLIAQAFVLFVAVAACLAILRREKAEDKVEST
jgi:hypothetical protein